MRPALKRWLIVLVAAGVITAASVVVARSDDSKNPARSQAETTTPTTTLTSRELVRFDDLPTMVATSAIVVDASVLRTEPGARSGAGHDQQAYTDAVLRIHDVLYGDAPAGAITVEELTESAGQSIQLHGSEHLAAGDSGIFFLRHSVHGDNYVLTSTQGRYLADGAGDLRGADQRDPLIERLSNRSRAELRADIERAKTAVNEGRVKAKPLPRSVDP